MEKDDTLVEATKRALSVPFDTEKSKTCRATSKQYCFVSGCPDCTCCQKLTTLVDFEFQYRPKNYLRRKI